MRLAFVLAALSLATSSMAAATFELDVQGKPVAGGEICLFDARSTTDPVVRFTAFTRVICTTADGEVKIPAGTWNLFARHKDGFVSPIVTLTAPDNPLKARKIDLVPAGRIEIDGKHTEPLRQAAYVESSGALFPRAMDDDGILVPADEPVFVVMLEDGLPIRISKRVRVPQGEVLRIRAEEMSALGAIAGVAVDEAGRERVASDARDPGRVEIIAAGREPLPSVNRVDVAFRGGGDALAFFPKEGAAVRLSGDGWVQDEVNVESGRAVRPLRVVPALTLKVYWSAEAGLATLAERMRGQSECPRQAGRAVVDDVPGVDGEGLQLTLTRCASMHAGATARTLRKSGCVVVAGARLNPEEAGGTVTLAGAGPGLHLLRLGYERLPAAFELVEVSGLAPAAEIHLRFDRWFGKVARGSEPLHAWIGIGSGAISDPDTGEYFTLSQPQRPLPPEVEARLFKDPPPVLVAGCTGEIELMFVPESKPLPNARFDIDVTPTAVRVHAVAASDGSSINGVQVEYSVVRSDDPDSALFNGPPGLTDDDGVATFRDVPAHRDILVCASHEDYESACADRFRLGDRREREVTISLERAEVRKGIVRNPAAAGGTVYWHRPDGTRVEAVSIAADGTFKFRMAHARGEIVLITSPTAPLYVFRQPQLRDEELFDINYPAAPVRSFSVILPATARETKGFVSLSIGDITVPLNVLSAHLRTRGARPVFLAAGSVPVSDVLATGPIRFIFAPMSWAEMNGAGGRADFFYLPAAVGLPGVEAGAGSEVVIPD
jgi:hypothetical protein